MYGTGGLVICALPGGGYQLPKFKLTLPDR
jgi:hypothetical protein